MARHGAEPVERREASLKPAPRDGVLAGSIRDDGPLPEVITDTLRAQDAMRRRCRRVRLALFVATLLHSVATGNMLPAATRGETTARPVPWRHGSEVGGPR